MFAFNPETCNFCFNPFSFESDAQFTLIGILLGLAIINTVLLDMAMVIYLKVLGCKDTFEVLQEFEPIII
jgi:ubiquitin-protein ligase E3 A